MARRRSHQRIEAPVEEGFQDADLLAEQLHGLSSANLDELRKVWRSRWGPPVRLRSTRMLRHIIAWRLQCDVSGGLDEDLKLRLRSTAIPRCNNPPAGTRLTREYQGVLHHVEIVERGVIYQGEVMSSLSRVARVITGVRWNGPRFFGLRKAPYQ